MNGVASPGFTSQLCAHGRSLELTLVLSFWSCVYTVVSTCNSILMNRSWYAPSVAGMAPSLVPRPGYEASRHPATSS